MHTAICEKELISSFKGRLELATFLNRWIFYTVAGNRGLHPKGMERAMAVELVS
jgi:hypothetical protein